LHIAKTNYSFNILNEAYPDKVVYIPNSYDPDIFKYNDNFPPQDRAVGYVGRIVPWKGLKDVAKACFDLKYKLMIMGKMDKPSYWAEIPEAHRENIDHSFFNCEDKDRPEFYKNITVYVGNSGPKHEVGTLGFIEAMACGVPIVTTPSGLAEDIGVDDENMLITGYDDCDELKENLQRLMESPALQVRLRAKAWETIRNFNDERMAWEYRKAYDRLLHGQNALVSVIIPATYDRKQNVLDILKGLSDQTYKHFEAVVVWDEQFAETTDILETSQYTFPVKQKITFREGYNLAMARNMGVIEADGKYLMFCDSRMKPRPESIKVFLDHILDAQKKVWLFGDKGGHKKNFVENFSFIERSEFIKAGMCNERISRYGGMSQELRERFSAQGFDLKYVPEALADQLSKSGMDNRKRDDIIKMKNLIYKLGL